MKLVSSHYPPGKVSRQTMLVATALAVLMIVMITAQLITIEKFIPVMDSYRLPGGPVFTKITIFLIVTSGVLSLPFLLRMGLSLAFRIVSAFSLVLHASVWVGLGWWAMVEQSPLTGTGILGGLFRSMPQEVIVPFSISLLVSSLFTAWLLRKDLTLSQ